MSKPLRVLIVEDSVADAELLLYELRQGGYDPIGSLTPGAFPPIIIPHPELHSAF